MVETIKKKVVKEVDEIAGEECTCDICNKTIYSYTFGKAKTPGATLEEVKYWHAYTGHYDWGNDSVDSIEHFDLCSPQCCKELMGRYIEENCTESRTAYLNISKETKSYITIKEPKTIGVVTW